MNRFSSLYRTYLLIFVIVWTPLGLNDLYAQSATITTYDIKIVLDLSNRLQKPRQVEEDTMMVAAIIDKVQQRAKSLVYMRTDAIEIDVLPQFTTQIEVLDQLKEVDLRIVNEGKQKEKKNKRKMQEQMILLHKALDLASQADKFSGGNIYTYIDEKFSDGGGIPSNDNLLVFITDGYFHDDSTLVESGNRYSSMYSLMKKYRDLGDWEKRVKEDSAGLIFPPGASMEGYRVLVIGIDPLGGGRYLNERAMLWYFIGQFFEDLGVKCEHIVLDNLRNAKEAGERFEELISVVGSSRKCPTD